MHHKEKEKQKLKLNLNLNQKRNQRALKIPTGLKREVVPIISEWMEARPNL